MESIATLITALKTPFTKAGDIDFVAFERLLLRQCASGVSGFVIAGTTGDGCFLSGEEQLELIRIARACAGEKAMVIGATSYLETREMIKRTTKGFEAGISASLLLPPYYIRPGMEAILDYFIAALDIGPGIIYNVPHRTGVDVGAEEILKLSTHKNFLGVKECTGLERSQEHHRNGIRVWSGNDASAEKEVRSGAAFGVISVVSNLTPQTAGQLFFQEKTTTTAPLETFITQLNGFPNPVGISTAMAMVGLVEAVLWRPYKIVEAAAQEKMLPQLKQLATQELDFQTPHEVSEKDWVLI